MRTAEHVPLAPLTTLNLGGPARRLVEVGSQEELIRAVTEADGAGERVLLLAGGSNVVIADEGFDGTVVRIATRGIEIERAPDGHVLVTAQAGEDWDALVARCVADRLAGVECLSGIPGSTGATPIQNVGAYGQEVADTVRSVRVLDRASCEVHDLPPSACGFAYRASAFKGSDRRVVLEATFALTPSSAGAPVRYAELARRLGVEVGETAPIDDVRAAVLALRRGKGMVVDPSDPDSVSAGSFFTNPILDPDAFAALARRAGASPPSWPEPGGRVKTSAAWLIERAGFGKGYGDGPAGISSKHTLALVNRGGASARDLLAVAREVASGVEREFGVRLHPEPVLVGLAW